MAGGSMTASLTELGPQFERATGHKVAVHFAATPDLIKEATSGTPFDLGVVPVDVMKDAAARAHFARRADDRHRAGRLRRRLPGRRPQARRRHARRAQADAAQGAIHHLHPGKRGRRLCAEGVRPSRHRRRDESQDQAANRDRGDRPGGGQRRRRARRIPHQCADRARRGARRPVPRPTCRTSWCSRRRSPPTARKRTPPRPSSIFSSRRKPSRCSRPRA